MQLWLVWLLGTVVHTFATQVPVEKSGWSWQQEGALPNSEPEDANNGETQEARFIPDVNESTNIEVVEPPTDLRSVSK